MLPCQLCQQLFICRFVLRTEFREFVCFLFLFFPNQTKIAPPPQTIPQNPSSHGSHPSPPDVCVAAAADWLVMEGRECKAVIDNVCLNPRLLGLWAGNSNNNGNITAEKSCLTSAISLLIRQLLWDFRKRFGVSFEQSTSFPSQMLCFCSWGGGGDRLPKGLLLFEIHFFYKMDTK